MSATSAIAKGACLCGAAGLTVIEGAGIVVTLPAVAAVGVVAIAGVTAYGIVDTVAKSDKKITYEKTTKFSIG